MPKRAELTDSEKHYQGFIDRMKELQKNDDTESAHGEADGILCEFLTELGYSDLVLEFSKVPKWYA